MTTAKITLNGRKPNEVLILTGFADDGGAHVLLRFGGAEIVVRADELHNAIRAFRAAYGN